MRAVALLYKELMRTAGCGAPVVTVQADVGPPGAERVVRGLSSDSGGSSTRFSKKNPSWLLARPVVTTAPVVTVGRE